VVTERLCSIRGVLIEGELKNRGTFSGDQHLRSPGWSGACRTSAAQFDREGALGCPGVPLALAAARLPAGEGGRGGPAGAQNPPLAGVGAVVGG